MTSSGDGSTSCGRASPAAVAVDDDAPGDRHQPGAYRSGRPIELTGVLPGTDEGLLHDVLGALPVSGDQSQDVCQQGTGVFSVQSTHQLLVGFRGLGHAMSGPRCTFIGHDGILAHAHLRCPGVPPVGRSTCRTEVSGWAFKER